MIKPSIVLFFTLIVFNGLTQAKSDESIDTIVEHNSPSNLDMSRHQLFIDTTRESEYYKSRNWRHLDSANNYVKVLINDLFEEVDKYQKVELDAFPLTWTVIRKYGEKLVLYDRCDGSDPFYRISDSTLNVYGPLEFNAYIITDVFEKTKEQVILELLDHDNSKLTFSITELDRAGVYCLNFKSDTIDETVFVIPTDKMVDYNLLVNHCPNYKVTEYIRILDQ